MNDLFAKLLESLRGTSAGTKLVAALCGAGLLVVVGLAAVVGSRPEPRPTFFGLDDHDLAQVSRSLAAEGILFEVSAGGAPYTVSVDRNARSAAFAAAYGSGAFDKPLRGILSEGGVASVFHSAEERRQGVRKKEWGEMELMLETLDYVVRASVRTSAGRTSPIERDPAPQTASVTVRTTGRLERAQEEAIARIVSRGLGVAREHLFVSDSEGNVLFDGSVEREDGFDAKDARQAEAEHDEHLAERANSVLDRILGTGRAYVVVASEWNYEKSSTHSETPTGKGSILLEETSSTSERPRPGGGGVPGISSNTATSDPLAAAPGLGTPSGPEVEKTSESTKRYAPTVTTEERVSDVPILERLSVALYIDDSLPAEQMADIERAVQTSVGYDAARDVFHRAALTFRPPDAADEVAPGEELTAPSPMLDTLLQRGVEIVLALVFVVLLLKSLRAAGRARTEDGETAGATPAEELDVELLARARVDELLRSDPDKVGEILSSWARGEEQAGTRP